MKNKISIVLLMSFFCAVFTKAQEFKFTLGGYSQIEYGTDGSPSFDQNNLHFGDIQTTIRPILLWTKESLKLHLEPNFSEVLVDDSNWLKEAWLGYEFDGLLSVRVGRIPRSNIMLTPHPKNMPISRYPRVPENIFGWGAQITKKCDNFIFMWDVTTDSDVSFQGHEVFSGIESSLRMQYNLTEKWFIAGSVAYDFEVSDLFGAINLGYSSSKWNLNAVAYSKEGLQGGFLMTTYRALDDLEIHGGVDVQYENGSNQVLGIRLFWGGNDETDLTVDYIHSDFRKDEHTAVIRFRHRF